MQGLLQVTKRKACCKTCFSGAPWVLSLGLTHFANRYETVLSLTNWALARVLCKALAPGFHCFCIHWNWVFAQAEHLFKYLAISDLKCLKHLKHEELLS